MKGMTSSNLLLYIIVLFIRTSQAAHISSPPQVTGGGGRLGLVGGVEVQCGSDAMLIAVQAGAGTFDGMIYPRGLARNSSCMAVYRKQKAPLSYTLPLSACNTMSSNMDDGTIEYFNTIVVQPHRKLVTSQGKGFHVRCRYTTREKMITNDINVSGLEAVTVYGKAPMPGCSMVIYKGSEVAQNVRIGEPLKLVVSIDEQRVYSMRLSHCSVTDATNSAKQPLIDDQGCSVDPEIMGAFTYSDNGTVASVEFQAHKFPFTDSVYYHCNVQLCFRDQCPPLNTEKCVPGRKKRETDEGIPAMIEVYSGLYVNEATDLSKPEDLVRQRPIDNPNNICISQRNFAIGIAVAGIVLMLLVVTAFIILLARRRGRKDISSSSIYSGPYTNTAYSHTS